MVKLTACKFNLFKVKNSPVVTGYLFEDEYEQFFDINPRIKGIEGDDLEFLKAWVIHIYMEGRKNEIDLLSVIERAKTGMMINDNYYDYDELEETLKNIEV